MNKKDLMIYRVVTALFSLMILGGASMYFMDYEMVKGKFIELGYPTYIIYPLAIAKILGVIAIWTKKSKTLKSWAYAGYVFDLILAVAAHIAIQDGEYFAAGIGLILVLVSYFYDQKLFDGNGNLAGQ